MSRWLPLLLVACSVPPQGWPDDAPIGDTDVADSPGALFGVVRDDAGQPIADAHLTTVPMGFGTATGADGAYSLDRLPEQRYDLVVTAPGHNQQRVQGLDVVSGQGMELDVVLPVGGAEGWALVQVLGPDGLPLAGAQVTSSAGDDLLSDDQGWASVPLAVPLDLTISHADTWPRTVRSLAPRAGNLHLAVQLSGRPASDATAVGSESCVGCHADIASGHRGTAHWAAHDPWPQGEVERSHDDGVFVDLGGPSAELGWVLAEPTVWLVASSGERRAYAVAGYMGSHEGATVPLTEVGGQSYGLPLAWVAQDSERAPYPDAVARWVPHDQAQWFDASGEFTEHADLPEPSASAESQCLPCHVSGFELDLRPDGGVDLWDPISGQAFAESGVGCERCHGPGSTHVAATEARRPFTITQPARLDVDRANEVCAQCHARTEGLATGLPHPFGDDGYLPGGTLGEHATSTATHWPSGAAVQAGQQADELALGPHGEGTLYALRCYDCHDPHGQSTDADGAPVPTSLRLPASDNSLCAGCHLGLSYGGDEATMQAHTGHGTYDPAGPSQAGRCVTCHMPKTPSRVARSQASGAGDVRSHLFQARPPQDALDAFTVSGSDTLPVGEFPTYGCADCHALNEWRLGELPGAPVGDPTLRATHQGFQDAYEVMYP